ncbi:MAG: DUF3488 domain-containing protein, partial [Gammaproteobacteria bacterium]|nr:DUF3488 domain-containing protein [Gammaproteobacteria bacterium]
MNKKNGRGLRGNTPSFLVISHSIVVLPHIPNHSWWVIGLAFFCVLWRILSDYGGRFLPGKAARFLLVLCGFGVVYMAYDTLIGPLAGVALLILA